MTNVTATLNSAKTLLTVSYGANNSNSNKSAKVSVYGNDIYGYGRNDYVTITQRPAVSVSLSPSTSTIPNTQENTQFGVTYSPSGASLSYTVVSGSDLIDTTRTRFIDSGGAKYLIVYTNSNTGTSAKTATINVTATNSGDSVTSNTVTVTKQGTAGTITLNPSSVTVGADAGSTSVGITTSNMNLSTLSYTVSSSSTMTINGVTFNSDKTQATISYAANNSTSAEKSATITISGTDVWGYSTSATVTLTQRKARPTLSVSPDSATLTATESPVMFVVQHTAGVTLAYTVSGDIVIDSTSFESVDSTVSRFWIYPHPNASTTSKVSTFRITTSYYGETVQSNQFTLTQQGVPGYVSLSPNTATVNGASGTVEFDITKYQMQDNTLATNIYDNTMNNVVASFNAEKTKLIVTYGANTGSSDLSAKVSVYGLDIYGYNRNDYVTITQKAQGTIAFNPATKTVGYLSDTTSMALVLNNVDPSTITVSSNESWAIPTFNTSTRQVSIYYLDN